MANYCNKICNDYYCEMNAKGRCHAPNPCLGYEEAAELISELKAAKREIEALRKRESGDVAKLREAALRQKELLQTIYSRGSVDRRELCAGMGLIDAALAAPPRNCDRFGSSTQARAEWYKTEVLPRVEGVVSGVEPPFVDWLLAPATKKEGGAK